MKRFIKNIVIIILIAVLILPTPTQVQAEIDITSNGTGGGGAGANGSAHGGATQYKCGYRIYVVDSQGKVVTNVIDLTTEESPAKTTHYRYLGTRVDPDAKTTEDSYHMLRDMPHPYIYSGNKFVGQGAALKTWLTANNNLKLKVLLGGLTIKPSYKKKDKLGNPFGVKSNPRKAIDLFDLKYAKYEYNFIIEPITWHDIFSNSNSSSNTGKSFYGTFYGWLKLYSQRGYGSTFTAPLDRNVLGSCLYIQRLDDELGFKKGNLISSPYTLNQVLPPNRAEDSRGYGVGLQIYTNGVADSDDAIQTTCDEDEEDPHKPDASESADAIAKNYNIIKLYRTKVTKLDGTVKYEDHICKYVKNIAKEIHIETEPNVDEGAYKVIAWKRTNKFKSNLTKWEDVPGTVKAHNGSLPTNNNPVVVQMDNNGKNLYVLLEKEETETPTNTGTYTLNESDITQKIKLSDTAKLLNTDGTNKLLTHVFTWESPKFTLTACKGDPDRTDHKHYINHGTQTGTITLIPDCDNYTVSDGTTTNAKFKVTS